MCTSTHEARGVQGHAPPGNFGIFEVLKIVFRAFLEAIILVPYMYIDFLGLAILFLVWKMD